MKTEIINYTQINHRKNNLLHVIMCWMLIFHFLTIIIFAKTKIVMHIRYVAIGQLKLLNRLSGGSECNQDFWIQVNLFRNNEKKRITEMLHCFKILLIKIALIHFSAPPYYFYILQSVNILTYVWIAYRCTMYKLCVLNCSHVLVDIRKFN